MNLKINLQEDAELRAYIKNMIRGQVLSIVREEVKAVIKEVFEGKFAHLDTKATAEQMLREEMKETIRKRFKTDAWGGSQELKEVAKEVILAEVKRAMEGLIPATPQP